MHVELDPKSVAVWEEIAKDYETKHPDVDIQLQFLENEAFKAKLPTLLQSNDVPDFFYSWGGGVLEEQSKTGALKDLTEIFDADGGKIRNAYNPAAIDGLSFDGKSGLCRIASASSASSTTSSCFPRPASRRKTSRHGMILAPR